MIQNGIPFDVAHDLVESGPWGESRTMAYIVAFGTLKGGEFDWNLYKWKEKKGGG